MTSKPQPHTGLTLYQIRVKGHLPDYWSDWFGGLTLILDAERGETLLSGPVVDQAALYGILLKLHNLNLSLLSVNCVEAEAQE
ncbi:MAG: hypothetical protein KJ077_41675 [Anaerolineae bacterium]|nr:hypothetical protein [Anaerolineae bacterium]